MPRRCVILCPLGIESRAARRVAPPGVDVVVTGPGANLTRMLSAMNLRGGDATLLVLFGVAGGLTATEAAPAISEVIDARAHERFRPSIPAQGLAIVGVDQAVGSPEQKRSLHTATGAALVDMESHHFARWCTTRRLQWTIVRGVSDGPDQSLPAHAARWIDDSGRTRTGRILTDTVVNPKLALTLPRLAKSTKHALQAASARLATLFEEGAGTITTDETALDRAAS